MLAGNQSSAYSADQDKLVLSSETAAMTEAKQDQIVLGKISDNLTVDEFIVRHINENGDQVVVQGHVTNKTNATLEDLNIDVSYYDPSGKFLGLDKSGILDTDEIGAKCSIPFSMDLNIPNGTSKCVLNIYTKKMASGLIMKWLYKGKG